MQRKVLIFFTFLLIICSGTLRSQSNNYYKTISDRTDSIISDAIKNKQIIGATAAIVSGDSVFLLKGFGRDSENGNRVVDARTSRFQIGSIGKLFTALVVLQMNERDSLDLNEPIQKYLPVEINQILSGSPITLFHLLTHSAGLNDRVIGYAAKNPELRIPLERHLIERLPGPYTGPGEEISYSNYAYALAGYIAQKQAGKPFHDLVNSMIIRPLRMDHTGYPGLTGSLPGSEVTGYQVDEKGFASGPAKRIYSNPVPAGSVSSTSKDMSEFLRMFLNRGRVGDSNIITEDEIGKMFKPLFESHPDLCGYSLGFETWEHNGTRIFSKGGMVPGFVSIIILIPDKDLGIFLSVNSSSDDVVEKTVMSYWPVVFENGKKQKPVIHVDETGTDLHQFAGSYRLNRLNRNTIEELFGQFRNTFNVWSISDTLKAFHDGEIHSYLEETKQVFTDVNDPDRKMVFTIDASGHLKLHRDIRIAGAYVPGTYEKIPWYDSNDFLNEWFGIFIIGMMLFLLYPGAYIIQFLVSRRKVLNRPIVINVVTISAFLTSLSAFIWIKGYFLKLLRMGSDLVFGIPEALIKYNFLPFLMIMLVLVGLVFSFRMLKMRLGSKSLIVFLLIHNLSTSVFLMVLYRWHFIGFYY